MPEEQLQQIIALLNAEEDISAAYLLGSAAKGCLRSDSDIDIAILAREKASVSSWDRLRLAGELSRVVGRTVDLGILSTDNLIYARETLLTGKRILCRDRFFCDMFGATALGLYAESRVWTHQAACRRSGCRKQR